jgi:hypothetical protein
MKSKGRQILSSLIFSVVLAIIVAVLQQTDLSEKLLHPQIWSIVIFSAILGIVVVLISHWGLESMDAQSRPTLFIGLTVLRLIVSMIFIGIVVFTGLEDRVLWVVDFFMLYLCYLTFEVYSILANLRAISSEGVKP